MYCTYVIQYTFKSQNWSLLSLLNTKLRLSLLKKYLKIKWIWTGKLCMQERLKEVRCQFVKINSLSTLFNLLSCSWNRRSRTIWRQWGGTRVYMFLGVSISWNRRETWSWRQQWGICFLWLVYFMLVYILWTCLECTSNFH